MSSYSHFNPYLSPPSLPGTTLLPPDWGALGSHVYQGRISRVCSWETVPERTGQKGKTTANLSTPDRGGEKSNADKSRWGRLSSVGSSLHRSWQVHFPGVANISHLVGERNSPRHPDENLSGSASLGPGGPPPQCCLKEEGTLPGA